MAGAPDPQALLAERVRARALRAGQGEPAAGPETHAALKRLAQELEGVFVNQLFQAMRSTVPSGGPFGPNPGEELFTSMLDQSLAQEAARHLDGGIADALYRQLARRLEPETPGVAGAGPDAVDRAR
jgi:flagellar protein FlgJ